MSINSKEAYPIWKKSLIESGRTFILAFATVIYTFFEAGVDLREWETWASTLLLSATAAGVKAVFRYARDKFGNGNYSSLWYKLTL